MIKLETEFTSGEGGFSQDVLTYKQVKRTDSVAMYERSRDGKVRDYEVFFIRVEPKGKEQKFPNGVVKVLEDDTEHYPSTGQWGKVAWTCLTLSQSNAKFEKLLKQDAQEEAEEETGSVTKEIVIPVGEFSTTEFGEKTGITYAQAAIFIRDAVVNNTIKFVREERRNARGKMTKIYSKA